MFGSGGGGVNRMFEYAMTGQEAFEIVAPDVGLSVSQVEGLRFQVGIGARSAPAMSAFPNANFNKMFFAMPRGVPQNWKHLEVRLDGFKQTGYRYIAAGAGWFWPKSTGYEGVAALCRGSASLGNVYSGCGSYALKASGAVAGIANGVVGRFTRWPQEAGTTEMFRARVANIRADGQFNRVFAEVDDPSFQKGIATPKLGLIFCQPLNSGVGSLENIEFSGVTFRWWY